MEFDFFKQFTDEDFFSGNTMSEFEFELLDLEEDPVIRIGGAWSWDQTVHPEYRALAGFKFSPEAAESFKPETRAKMMVVDLVTGTSETMSFPVVQKALAQSPNKPSSKEIRCFRKKIKLPAASIDGPWHRWRLFVYSGNALSNPLDFETGHRELTEKDRRIPPHLLREPIEQELSSQIFAQRSASPKLDAPGIAFAQEATEASIDGKRSIRPLDLTVYIPDDFPPQQRWVPVRLLFGSEVNWASHSLEILIPKERTTKVEGGLLAHYTLDLAPLLVDSSTGKPVHPKEWYLTAICKGVFAGPTSLTVPVP